jgi:hypothetical protein
VSAPGPGRARRGGGQAGPNRANRGGSWRNDAQNARAAYRNANDPSKRNDNLGLRLSRAPRPARRPTEAPTASTAAPQRPTPQGPGGPVSPAAAAPIARRAPAPFLREGARR